MTTIVCGKRVLPDRVLPDGAVAIADGWIVAVGGRPMRFEELFPAGGP